MALAVWARQRSLAEGKVARAKARIFDEVTTTSCGARLVVLEAVLR
ncbi:hypothetical protein [Microbacterium sp.]